MEAETASEFFFCALQMLLALKVHFGALRPIEAARGRSRETDARG